MVRRQVESGLDYRLHTPAGWTGPAQVEKGMTQPSGYSNLDLAYVEACRRATGLGVVARDVRTLWRTVKVLARGEGLQY